MGYETRIHIVSKYSFAISENYPDSGSELASIDLCKCGDGAVGQLIASAIKKAKSNRKFGLYARNPDKQREAVELLRDLADNETPFLTGKEMLELSNDIEDGYVTKDCYGDPLGVIPIQEFLNALEKDNTKDNYRRYEWAIALMKSIIATSEGELSRLFVVTYGH